MKGNMFLLIVLAVLMVIAIAVASNYPIYQAKMGPLLVSGAILLLVVIELIKEIRVAWVSAKAESAPANHAAWAFPRAYLIEVCWIAGYCVTINLLGFYIGIPAFIIAYMKSHEAKWITIILIAVLMTLCSYLIFSYFFGIELYRGLIFEQSAR